MKRRPAGASVGDSGASLQQIANLTTSRILTDVRLLGARTQPPARRGRKLFLCETRHDAWSNSCWYYKPAVVSRLKVLAATSHNSDLGYERHG